MCGARLKPSSHHPSPNFSLTRFQQDCLPPVDELRAALATDREHPIRTRSAIRKFLNSSCPLHLCPQPGSRLRAPTADGNPPRRRRNHDHEDPHQISNRRLTLPLSRTRADLVLRPPETREPHDAVCLIRAFDASKSGTRNPCPPSRVKAPSSPCALLRRVKIRLDRLRRRAKRQPP